jgi:hypothetical protein
MPLRNAKSQNNDDRSSLFMIVLYHSNLCPWNIDHEIVNSASLLFTMASFVSILCAILKAKVATGCEIEFGYISPIIGFTIGWLTAGV